jgi:hypothetical protein
LMALESSGRGCQADSDFFCWPWTKVDVTRSCISPVLPKSGPGGMAEEDSLSTGCVCSLMNGGAPTEDLVARRWASRIVAAAPGCSSQSAWLLPTVGVSNFDGAPSTSKSAASNLVVPFKGYAAIVSALGLDVSNWVSSSEMSRTSSCTFRIVNSLLVLFGEGSFDTSRLKKLAGPGPDRAFVLLSEVAAFVEGFDATSPIIPLTTPAWPLACDPAEGPASSPLAQIWRSASLEAGELGTLSVIFFVGSLTSTGVC